MSLYDCHGISLLVQNQSGIPITQTLSISYESGDFFTIWKYPYQIRSFYTQVHTQNN